MMFIDEEKKSFIKDLFVLAIPIGVQNLFNSLVSLFDNIMVGSLGEDCISAVNVCFTFGWLFSTISTAFASGALLMISRLWINKEMDKIKRILSFSLSLCTILGFLLFTITWIFPEEILRIYSDVESMIPIGIEYLSITKFSYLLNTISFSIMIIMRSIRKVKFSLIVSSISCVVNISLNYLLIYGNFGMPRLGVIGAAIATLVSRIVEIIIVVVYVFFIEKELAFRINEFNPQIDRDTFNSLFRITIPLLFIDFLSSLVSTMQTIITGHISKYYISANSIVHTSWEFPDILCWGFMQAANVMVGNVIGKKEYEKAYRYSYYFSICGIVMGIFSSVALHFIMPIVIYFYNVSNETLVLAKQMSYSASLIVLFSNLYGIAGEGVMKAGGNTKVLLKIDLICSWLFAIPLGALCAFVFKLPAYILYIVLRSNNILKTFWVAKRLKKKDWIINI